MSLYPDASAAAFWTETITTPVQGGYYAVNLGATPGNLLDLEDFDAATVHVGVGLGGPPATRTPVTSAPFALRAAVADSVAGSDVVGPIPLTAVPDAQARVTGTCSSGSAITAIASNGSVTCGATGGGTSGVVYANVTMPPQTIPSDGWFGLVTSGQSLGTGVTRMGRSLYFAHPGVYRITLDYRNGDGGDVWTAVRLYGDGGTRGISAGYAVNGPGSPDVTAVTFLARIRTTEVPYELQIGRLSAAQVIGTPSSIAGQALPAFTATFERVEDTVYADFQADASSFAANAWTPVNLAGVGHANGVTLTSGTDFTVSQTGTYWIDATYRLGTGTDVWTALALFQGGTIVNRSVGYGNLNASHEGFRPSLLANLTAGTAYNLRFGRLGSAMTTDNSSSIAGDRPPSINLTLTRADPAASAQLEGGGQTLAANWNNIAWSGTSLASGVAVSGSNVTFANPGTYRISVSYRNGVGADVWTAIRVLDQANNVRGVSTGYGNDADTPELQSVQFLFDVTDTTNPHRIQMGRSTSGLSIAGTTPIAGVALPAIVATITRVAAP